jgi:hypothetical protein
VLRDKKVVGLCFRAASDEGHQQRIVRRSDIKTKLYAYDRQFTTAFHYMKFVSLVPFGRNWALRLPVVFAGLGTIWLAWAYRRYPESTKPQSPRPAWHSTGFFGFRETKPFSS